VVKPNPLYSSTLNISESIQVVQYGRMGGYAQLYCNDKPALFRKFEVRRSEEMRLLLCYAMRRMQMVEIKDYEEKQR
jgi:hypothetical protein